MLSSQREKLVLRIGAAVGFKTFLEAFPCVLFPPRHSTVPPPYGLELEFLPIEMHFARSV